MIGRDWYVGMKVICVDDNWTTPKGWIEDDGTAHRDPRKGQVFVIVEIRPMLGRLMVGLEGQPEGWLYAASAFRPVQKRATDISIFTAMLTGKKTRADA